MPEGDVELRSGYLVKRVQQALRRRCDVALKPTGLSMAQYSVLRALAAHADTSAAELARLCFITRQSLQDIVRVLRSSGLIENDPPTRGRSRVLRVTDTGTHHLEAGTAALHIVESVMMAGVSDSAQDRLADLLTQCATNLEAGQASG